MRDDSLANKPSECVLNSTEGFGKWVLNSAEGFGKWVLKGLASGNIII